MINQAIGRRTIRLLSCFRPYPFETTNPIHIIGSHQSIFRLVGDRTFVSLLVPSAPTITAVSKQCSVSTINQSEARCYSTVNQGEKNPTAQDYNDILIKMTQTKGKVNFERMYDTLQQIESQKDIKLNEFTFFLMVKNCASMKTAKAAEAAEILLLEWAMEFYKQGRLDNAPNVNIFGVALQAWVNTKYRDSGRRAHQLLDKIESLVEQGDPPFVMNSKIYNTAMKAYAINGDYENAQVIFDKCMKAFEEGNENARPDAITWSTLLDACAKSNKPNAGKLAEDIFRKMQSSYQKGALKELPNTITYSSLINACAKSNQPQRAQNWLEKQYQDFETGNGLAKPNVRSFATVLDAWAREGTVEAAEQCEKILRRMKKLSKEGTLPVSPDTVCYSSVINAHAKSNQPQKAEDWLEAMYRDYKSGNSKAKPDVTSFSTVLDAWARVGTAEAAELCEKILRLMKKLTKEGTLPVRPNMFSYNSVINAWANVGNHQKARLAFDDMLRDYRKGNRNAQPDAVSCASLLKAFRESGLHDAGEMADAVLKEMEELRIRADLSSCVLVLQCWELSQKQGHPRANDRIQAMQEILDRMRAK